MPRIKLNKRTSQEEIGVGAKNISCPPTSHRHCGRKGVRKGRGGLLVGSQVREWMGLDSETPLAVEGLEFVSPSKMKSSWRVFQARNDII